MTGNLASLSDQELVDVIREAVERRLFDGAPAAETIYTVWSAMNEVERRLSPQRRNK